MSARNKPCNNESSRLANLSQLVRLIRQRGIDITKKLEKGLVEEPENSSKSPIYLKAFPLRNLEELEKIKNDIAKKVIVILRVTPLAQRDVEDLKQAVEQLYEFAVSIGGDIARLGEERVVITPPGVKIWRGLL